MSPYASELASARLDALRTLIDALNEAQTPDEKRRCAVAIFNAPDPCDLDDEIELEDDEGQEVTDTDTDTDTDTEPSNSEIHSQHDQHLDGAAPAPHDPASAITVAIRQHVSGIPLDVLANLTNEDIVSRVMAIADSVALNRPAAPP